MNIEGINIERLNHACFKIKNRKIIYIDPFKIEEDEPADIILITHGHYDHCSIEDIEKIVKDYTVIVATSDCVSKLNKFENNHLKIVKPGSELEIERVKIETVAAYNTNKQFHPKQEEWVGYIITVNGKRIYHTGDSDIIPEMSNLNVDIALLPVSGTYVMTAKEAAQIANKIKPKVVVPMHYGSIIGSEKDAENFKKLVDKNIKVEIL